jgi:Protein of unknown function (DUF3224)
MIVKGSFAITMHPDPPYEVVEKVALGRARVDKRFSGPLDATSVVNMIGARTANDGSAGYVAIERVTGNLEKRAGTFVLQHSAVMSGGTSSLTVVIVPDSGTGQLAGISGRMDIQIVDGKHFYELDYQLGG